MMRTGIRPGLLLCILLGLACVHGGRWPWHQQPASKSVRTLTTSATKDKRPSGEGSVSGTGPWGAAAGPHWWGSSSNGKEAGPGASSKGSVERTVMSAGSKTMVKVGSKPKDAATAASLSSSSTKGDTKHKNEAVAAEPSPKQAARASAASMGVVAKLMDELRYRLIGLDSYRQSVQARVDASLERFQQRSQRASKDLQKDVDQQLAKALALHEWYMEHLSKQQQRLADLTRTEIVQRQRTLNQSLEQFKKSYDDTLSNLRPDALVSKTFLTKAELKLQQQRLDESFSVVMATYTNSTVELRNFIERMVSFSGDLLPRLSLEEEHISGLVAKLREQQRNRMSSLGKPDLRSERQKWDEAIEGLKAQQEKVMKGFLSQAQDMERSLKSLKDRLNAFNQMYEDLITRKETKLYVETMNDKVLKRVLDCLEQKEADGWEYVTTSKGVTVHRKLLPALDGKMSNYCCVKATGVIEASPSTILKLFEDNSRVAEYNKFYAEGRDLEDINDSTKVVWASSPPLFFFKPRDFCTVVHYRKLQDGTICVVNRSAEHPDAPRTSKYVRGEILMGANIIQPIPNEPNKAMFTIVTQVDPGGFAPPVIVNKVTSLGPVNFFKDIEAAAQRPPPKTPVVNTGFSL